MFCLHVEKKNKNFFFVAQVATSLLVFQVIASQLIMRPYITGNEPPTTSRTKWLKMRYCHRCYFLSWFLIHTNNHNSIWFALVTGALLVVGVTIMLPFVDMMVAWLAQIAYFLVIHLIPVVVAICFCLKVSITQFYFS